MRIVGLPLLRLALLLTLGGGRLIAAPGEAMPVASGANAPGMKAIVYGFFDDKTGERIGRLQIEKVGVEYQRRGFLRVAWDPLVVLDGVTLEIGAGATWPEAGNKIIDALRVTGRQNSSVLRHVRLRLAGATPREIVAETATLRKDGGLELVGVENADGAGRPATTETLCFWLAGPRGGEVTSLVPGGTAVAQNSSAKQNLAPSAP